MARDTKSAHSPLGCHLGVPQIETKHVSWNFDAGVVVNPLADLREPPKEKVTIEMRFIGDREIEVFRESVGFKETFLETGTTLEIYNRKMENFIAGNSGEHPSERIILLDDLRSQREVACHAHDLLAADHDRFSA